MMSETRRCVIVFELSSIVEWLVMCFVILLCGFICLWFVGEVGVAFTFFLVGAIFSLPRRRLMKGFAEFSYASRFAPVLSVVWGLSRSVCVMGRRDVCCV